MTRMGTDNPGAPQYDYAYDYSELLADRSAATRTLAVIQLLSDCSLIHGVFHTATLQAAWKRTAAQIVPVRA